MTMAGYSVFAHSHPDKIGTPRLLPLYIRNIFKGLSAKKSAQILYPAIMEVEMFILFQKSEIKKGAG
jgi:hypothetical protein